MWLNEKHVGEGLDHKNLRVTTVKYFLDHGKHRYELVDEPKKQPNRIFIDKIPCLEGPENIFNFFNMHKLSQININHRFRTDRLAK